MNQRKTLIQKIMTMVLIITMILTGIAQGAMPSLLVANASPDDAQTETTKPNAIVEETSGTSGESEPSMMPESSGIPEAAQAAELALGKSSIELFSLTLGAGIVDGIPTDGVIDVTDGVLVTIAAGDNKKYEVIGTGSGRIVIQSGATPTLILNGVSITATSSPIELRAGATATILLADGKNNSLICTGNSGSSGLPQAGIHVAPSASLTIDATVARTGQLFSRAGDYAAGIGGAANEGCGDITILGGTIVAQTKSIAQNADATNNGAGIGGGGSASWPNVPTVGVITIKGDANVTARSGRHGAGIGGSGTERASTHDNVTVNISGKAIVNAISNGNGAGIGGGGLGASGIYGAAPNKPPIKKAGSGGIIKIFEQATVTATSGGSGAGLGGGGIGTGTAASTDADMVAGDGGTIHISGEANVTANGGASGTGIGGGGAVDANATTPKSTPGAGGDIVIDGNPIVTVSGLRSMGAGRFANGTPGASATRLNIINGNVYADKDTSDLITNSAGDELGRVDLGNQRPGIQEYDAMGAKAGPYKYHATRNAAGETHIWVPLGNQIVVHRYRDRPLPNDIIAITTQTLSAGALTPILALVSGIPPLDAGYELVGTEKSVTWTTGSVLSTIVYEYAKEATLPREVYALNDNGISFTKYVIGSDLNGGTILNPEINGPRTISAGGVYNVKSYDTVKGKIYVNTSQKVVLILNGTRWTNLRNFGDAGFVAGDDDAPIRLEKDADVTIVVMDNTENSFVNNSSNGSSASRTTGIFVQGRFNSDATVATESATLTITGGTLDENDYKNNGSLLAKSRIYSAGIGGGPNQYAGYINIWGGMITAHAGERNGAGIGGGGGHTAGGGKSAGITICGQANVTAISDEHGAGIGGAGGGYLSAASGMKPGPSDGGKITIYGSNQVKVSATSRANGAGIGGGGRSSNSVTDTEAVKGGEGGNITIRGNVEVVATSEGMGAGIGGAGALAYSAGDGGNISISGTAKVTALGNLEGAGIGGGGVHYSASAMPSGLAGRAGSGGNISITQNAEVTAMSNGRGAGIGGGGGNNGYGGNSNTLTFGDNIKINAQSTTSGAGIGGGGGTWGAGNGGTITIKEKAQIIASAGLGDGTLGSPMGAGIGGGGSAEGVAGDSGVVTISGNCYVEATAGGNDTGGGAAIGGGGSVNAGTPGSGGDVTIKMEGTDDTATPTVIAKGNSRGMDIGYGVKSTDVSSVGSEGTLTITSGNVWAVHENTPLATNGADVVKMRRAPHDDMNQTAPLGKELLKYRATGALKGQYRYTAYTDPASNDWAYVWKPSDEIDMQMDGLEDKKIYFEHDTTPLESLEFTGKAERKGSSFINDDYNEPFDNLTEAVKLEWIRVSTYDSEVYGERHTGQGVRSFDEKFAELRAADSDNFGTITVGPNLDADGNFKSETFKNGKIWIKITYGNRTGLTGDKYYEAGTGFHVFQVEHFYTILDVFARDVRVSMPGQIRTLVNDYEKLLNADTAPEVDSGVYGIPFDLDSSLKIVRGIQKPAGSGVYEPTLGYDAVKYIPYVDSALNNHKLTMPTIFKSDYTLTLDQRVIDNLEVDNLAVLNGGPKNPGNSSVNEKYYRMDYIEEYVLTVFKNVAGEFADTTKSFAFTATFTEKDVPYTEHIGWIISGANKPGASGVVKDGTHKFELSHGQRIEFFSFKAEDEIDASIVEDSVIGYATTYTVVKSTYESGSSSTPLTGNGDTATEKMDGNVEVVFINQRDSIVPTAATMPNNNLFVLMVGGLIAVVAISLLVKYRKSYRN